MKYFLFSVVFVFAALAAQAQLNIPDFYTPKQKHLNNGLKMLSPNLQNSKTIFIQHNTPVLQLKNEGVKVSSNNLGDVYRKTADNMLCLKPFATNDAMPNAIQPASPAILKEKK